MEVRERQKRELCRQESEDEYASWRLNHEANKAKRRKLLEEIDRRTGLVTRPKPLVEVMERFFDPEAVSPD